MGLDPAKTIGKERSDMAGATNQSSDPWNPRLEPIVLKNKRKSRNQHV